MDKKIAGVVLAGGRSSRMGQDKAGLDYNGKLLLDHMIALLERSGLSDVYVSGDLEGYRCIPDSALYEGPAAAIVNVLSVLKSYDGVLFVPVDMPLLTPEVLSFLLIQEQGAYFEAYPFPSYIVQYNEAQLKKSHGNGSLKSLLLELEVSSIALPSEFEACMMNTNTPDEWVEALRA